MREGRPSVVEMVDADALVDADVVERPELEERFPLEVAFCPHCALVQITEDHSLVETLVREGRITPEEARNSLALLKDAAAQAGVSLS